MSRRFIFISLFAGFAAAAGVASVLSLVGHGKPNVVIITVEGARAGVFTPARTPNLWKAAKSAVRFTKHRAVSAWTAPNVIGILTGVSPYDQGVHTRGNFVPGRWRLPLEVLAKNGWRVGGLQAFMRIDIFRNLGLGIEPGTDPFYWMAKNRADGAPFVLWHHYVGTHLPYAPAKPFRPDWKALLDPADKGAEARISEIMRQPAIPAGSVNFKKSDRPAIAALYHGGYREFDAWFGEFWDFLERSGLRDDTIVVVTADHGEELLERGNVGHASTTRQGQLFEEIVRLPLFVWLPPGMRPRGGKPPEMRPRGNPQNQASDHLDIMPTLIALLGQKPARVLEGRDLFGAAKPRTWSAVTSNAGFAEPEPENLTRFLHARIEGPWKLHLEIEGGKTVKTRLYHLSRDPGEIRDLSAAKPDIVARLSGPLLARARTMRPPSGAGDAAAQAAAARPGWVSPAGGGAFSYDDLKGRFRLEWSGNENTDYVVQYVAGTGVLQLKGEFRVQGPVKDFGVIGRGYWNTWVVPYGTFRIRVGVDGSDALWGPWLELKAKP